MLYFPMVFGEITTDDLIETGALTSTISEADLKETRLLAPQRVLNEETQPDVQVMVTSSPLETPSATVEVQFEVCDILF